CVDGQMESHWSLDVNGRSMAHRAGEVELLHIDTSGGQGVVRVAAGPRRLSGREPLCPKTIRGLGDEVNHPEVTRSRSTRGAVAGCTGFGGELDPSRRPDVVASMASSSRLDAPTLSNMRVR